MNKIPNNKKVSVKDLVNEEIQNKIYTIRNVQVMSDSDLAELYDVKIKRLNEQVKRNRERFPEEFMFQLTDDEFSFLRSQNATLETGRGSHRKYLPYVFSEQGIAMLSVVLRSETAIKISIQIIKAFVSMRNFITANTQIFHRFDLMEKKQLEYKTETDGKFDLIFNTINSKGIIPRQGIFFEGQIFDAYQFVSDLMRSAEKTIILIDVKVFKNSHDRFIIIDNKTVYQFGASLKDLGKKWFAFSKMDIGAVEMVARLRKADKLRRIGID